MSQALDRVRKAARQRKKEKFTALLHHISVETLEVAFYALKRKAAPGVDGVTWQEYEADIERRLADLHARIHRGAYRPQPSRRTYIPKADGKRRPLAIAALEDKIVQGATVMVLNAIYEEARAQVARSVIAQLKKFSGSPTGSVPDGERTMRWTPLR